MKDKVNSIKREIIINYVKKNPLATYNDIRKNTKLHPERYFKEGMKEIYKEAKVISPRKFERKTKEENRELIINYIKNNPTAGLQKIMKDTKRNPLNFFNNIKESYEQSGIKYPRENSYKSSPKQKREIIIKLVKENPDITLQEIKNITQIKNIYRLFKNFEEIYKKAEIKKRTGGEKIKNRKIKQIINYIRNNPKATQREINKNYKTHIQEIFNGGIIEAYKMAGIEYPFERLKLHGTAIKEIKERAKTFEEEIAIKLSGFGRVHRLIKTKRGIVDIILERKGKKIPIEIKDFQKKDISISQIKQLNKYAEDINSDIGILICHKKPKKDRFLIGKNRLFILEDQELNKILDIL